MALEGLNLVLKKEEVIPTVSASDLRSRSEQVEHTYKRHVRTYIPINRAAGGVEGNGVRNVDSFEKKVIKDIKEARAPRGYLTAEYGYGKTSTALYLWQRAEIANLIAVPPFQLLQLSDLITALYGWVRYRLNERAPVLIPELDALHEQAIGSSLEREAQERGVSEAALRQYVAEGRFILEMQPHEYVGFFERITEIAKRAGYEGILVMPDEVQQYIEPRLKRESEPITPLFNLIQGLATRNGYLNLGLIMVIPAKEIGLIRSMRDDLLHRMRDLSLDLTTIYDEEFATNLWSLLAKEFDFLDVRDKVVSADTLGSLGEISARQELSNGPRTVVNAFRRMVERYKSIRSPQPYSPIDLIEDFIGGAIPFAGNEQIPNITRRALQHQIVRANPERYEKAIKLAAAFPTNGVPSKIQQKWKVVEPLEELRMKALGELVVGAGDEQYRGVTLFGLHIGVQQSDWLTQTIRDFRRAYAEQHATTQERALNTFIHLLKAEIFKGWSVESERDANYVSDRSVIFEGHFQSFAAKFPKRRVHVRIFWEDQERKEETDEGDLSLEFYLTTHSDLRADPDARREKVIESQVNTEQHRVGICLNLMYMRPDSIPQNLKQQLQGVWSPYDLSPLVLMNIYALLNEKRAANLISPTDDQLIANAFQPELLDTVRKDLFNAGVGATFGGVSGGHIVEEAIRAALEARYPDYQTISASLNWNGTLTRDYFNALNQLENVYQKRGEIEFEGTKEDVARKLSRAATGLDSFRKQYPHLLKVEKDWSTREPKGAVRFTMHPLELKIRDWLREGPTERIQTGRQKADVHVIEMGTVYNQARQLGYKNEEIETILELMICREIIETHQRHLIREKPSQTVDVDAVGHALAEFQSELDVLERGFEGVQRLVNLRGYCKEYQERLEKVRQSKTPDPQQVHQLSKAVQVKHSELRDFAKEKHNDLRAQLHDMEGALRPFNHRQGDVLGNALTGSVMYIDQVNVLRTHLQRFSQTVKANIDGAKSRLEELKRNAGQEDLSYESLARINKEVSSSKEAIAQGNSKLSQFDEFFRHYQDWMRLVDVGSELANELSLLGNKTVEQAGSFDDLSRNIRGDISSRANKLEALPNHSTYSASLNTIREQVRLIRRNAEDEFTDLQNRYATALTANGLYSRENIGSAITFNPANPEESYRLLFERAKELCRRLCDQLEKKSVEERTGIQNLLYAEALRSLSEDERNHVQTEGQNLVKEAEQAQIDSAELREVSQREDIIRDFPTQNTGQFTRLTEEIIKVRDTLKDISGRSRLLSQKLKEISLTPQEEALLSKFPTENAEISVDIVDWLRHSGVSPEDFWRLIHALYDKRRIRINLSRMRN